LGLRGGAPHPSRRRARCRTGGK